jgi:ABC-type nitrate/sulfonate/bicarbonate transport system substrate-binding protein
MRFARISMVLFFVALLGACGGNGDDDTGSEQSGAPTGIRAAYASALDPNDVADQFGLDAVDAEVSTLSEDSAVVAAIAQGDIDIGNIDYTAAVLAREAGVPISIFYISQTTPEFTMVARSDITTFDQLAGKTIAYHCPGCTDEIFLRNIVKQNAPEAYDDVEWLVLEESPRRATALLAGRFEATDLEALSVAEVEKQAPGEYHPMAVWSDLEGDASSVVATVWIASEENLREDPDKYLAMAKELQRGYDRFYTDKEGWIELATEKLPDVDPTLLPGAYDVYEQTNMYPQTGTPPLTPSQWDTINKFYLDIGEFKEPQSDEMVDYSIINEASGTS